MPREVTRADIEGLAREATKKGDAGLLISCTNAIGGDWAAWKKVAAIIAARRILEASKPFEGTTP